MSQVVLENQQLAIGERFLAELAARDFYQIKALFQPRIRFRALVPPGIRRGADADEAIGWLRRWFGNADEFQILISSADQVADRLHIAYRIQLHRDDGWRVIEQQAYCVVDDGLIGTMNLLCSGFRPDPESQRSRPQKAEAITGTVTEAPQSYFSAAREA
jgi:hypothetical protein